MCARIDRGAALLKCDVFERMVGFGVGGFVGLGWFLEFECVDWDIVKKIYDEEGMSEFLMNF